MIFRAIDGANDWAFGQGVQSYFTNERAVSANIKTRLQVWLGECFFATEAGIDWRNILGGKNPAAQQAAVLQCRTVIVGSYGVVKVNSVNAVFNSASRALTITYSIDTIFSRSVTNSVQLLP
jgi:hypothetical protein